MNLWGWGLCGVMLMGTIPHLRQRVKARHAERATLARVLESLSRVEYGLPFTVDAGIDIYNALTFLYSDAATPGALAAARRYKAIRERAGYDGDQATRLIIQMLARDGRYAEAEELVLVELGRTAAPTGLMVQRRDRTFSGEDAIRLYRTMWLELLASLTYHQGRHREALDTLDEAIALTRSVDSAEDLLQGMNEKRAWCLLRLGQRAEAMELARTTLSNPRYPMEEIHFLNVLYTFALDIEDIAEAERYLDRIGRHPETSRRTLLWQKARLYSLKGRHAEAERLRRKSRPLFPVRYTGWVEHVMKSPPTDFRMW